MQYSIIVPVHNAELYIERCVNSILAQTAEVQILLIENGSTDRTLSICEQFAEKYENIDLHVSEDTGVSSARNLGLKHARGEIIGFCDADDYYEPDALAKVERAFSESDADVVFTATRCLSNEKTTLLVHEREELIDSSRAIDYITCNPNTMGSVWNKFYRRELLRDMVFPEDLTHLEDGYMNIRLLSLNKGIEVLVTKDITYNYVSNESSATNVIEKCFNSEDQLKYIVALNRMLEDLELNKDGRNSIKDQKYRIAATWYYKHRRELSDRRKKLLYDEVKGNYPAFIRRLFKYDVVRRLKFAVLGLLIIVKCIA